VQNEVGVMSAPASAGEATNVATVTPSGSVFAQRTSRWRDLARLFTGNRLSLAGLCIVLFFVLIAAFGPLFVHQNPNAFSAASLVPPSAQHWLGTTKTGQDVFAQLIVGTRISLLWGFITGLVITAVVVIIGITSGYVGGIVDDILSLLMNIFLIIPGLVLAIVLAAFIPFKGEASVAFAIVIPGWAYGARTLRAQTLSLRSRDFVDAARASGESLWRILFFEILPNEISIVAASFIGTVIYVIIAAASLEFLGLGDINTIDWGTMLYWAQNNDALLLGAWWWFVPPGLCIAVLGAGLTLINFGMDEVANPRLRREPKLKKIKEKIMSARKAVA
jgi:peptide/nickel transport system permease protein